MKAELILTLVDRVETLILLKNINLVFGVVNGKLMAEGILRGQFGIIIIMVLKVASRGKISMSIRGRDQRHRSSSVKWRTRLHRYRRSDWWMVSLWLSSDSVGP